MKHAVIFFFAALLCAPSRAQLLNRMDTVGASSVTDNIYNRKLAGDSLVSSFCILIKKEVKAHKHLYHSEHVLVLEGEGLMLLADSSFTIRKDDLIFIPKNTVHGVTRKGKIPLKVLSIQAPYFDGKDRVMVTE
jgi:mannose-6-phosphate isomerase-like protein (cupin superfamily)